MAEGRIRTLVDSFYDAFASGDVEGLRSTLAEDVVLTFGPFRFEGVEKVAEWVAGLKREFPYLGFKEASLKAEESEVHHKFTLRVIGPNRVRGRLPCLGRYSLKDGKIHRASVRSSEGVLEISAGDIVRLMLI